MPEIGETLREARMRRRIDMTEVETATKIRAKYLRALENEEWDLLPGPTFVKTFLRTYAEYLGLDARLLVEEYRQRYERPSSQDLTPFAVGSRRAGGGRRRGAAAGSGLLRPGIVLAMGAVLLLGALYLLGTLGGDDGPETPATPPRAGDGAAAGDGGAAERRRERRREAREGGREQERERPTRVELQLVTTGEVYVCLVDAGGNELVDGQILAAGTRTETFRSQSFVMNLGNGALRMRIDGENVQVPESANGIGYELRPGRDPRRLPDAGRPDCT